MDLPKLSQEAREALIFLKLKSGDILSLSKVYNDRCQIILTNKDIAIVKREDIFPQLDKNRTILSGKQDIINKLWYIDNNKQAVDTKKKYTDKYHNNNWHKKTACTILS